MSDFTKETARILREHFGRTKRDADWLSNNTRMGITPRTDRDAQELARAEQMASMAIALSAIGEHP